MRLDEQFEFLEYFKQVLARQDEFKRFVIGQLVDYLERRMFMNLDDWLRSEMSR